MARSRSSRRWLAEHFADPFVRQAKAEGLRSRAAFKLEELLPELALRSGMVVVDLGAAPGGWSQVIARALAGRGRIVALDLLPMAPIAGVEFLQGDFRAEATLQQLRERLGGGRRVDLVLSDMAPNMSGVRAVDLDRAQALAELALDFAEEELAAGGALLAKLFHGPGFDSLLRRLRRSFAKVVVRKPTASRARSPEVYVHASGFRAPG